MQEILIAEVFGDIPLLVTLGCACVCVFVVGRLVIQMPNERKTIDAEALSSETGQAQADPSVNVVDELRQIAELIRRDLVAHDRSFETFKDYVCRLNEAPEADREQARERLTERAQDVLQQTNQLTDQISKAFEDIHSKAMDLVTLAEMSNGC